MSEEQKLKRLNLSLSVETRQRVEAVLPYFQHLERASVAEAMILEMIKLMEAEPAERKVPQLVLQYDAAKRPVGFSSKLERGQELSECFPPKTKAEPPRRK